MSDSQKIYVGWDNGVTGSISIITQDDYFFYLTPVFKQQDYTNKKKIVTRIDISAIRSIFSGIDSSKVLCVLERPAISPQRWTSSLSAIRAHEACLIIIEELGFSHMFVDSKSWQKEMLPVGSRTTIELKAQSFYAAIRLFPKCEDEITKRGDGDSILISEWAKRYNNGNLKKALKNP